MFIDLSRPSNLSIQFFTRFLPSNLSIHLIDMSLPSNLSIMTTVAMTQVAATTTDVEEGRCIEDMYAFAFLSQAR